uniref:Uncharacterized protein n=1 Tax=Siphoviridae sp. ctOkv13 TaxID=2826314 RepID=A0A8S5M348_9CAUD|nr:MAG TPA: hypothetical protein [Siphoviridae sp. ctOkv13]
MIKRNRNLCKKILLYITNIDILMKIKLFYLLLLV